MNAKMKEYINKLPATDDAHKMLRVCFNIHGRYLLARNPSTSFDEILEKAVRDNRKNYPDFKIHFEG